MNIEALAAEFPRNVVSWRAQTLTKTGDKALALAYIDARDVMDRLDAVCGVDGWQCDYPHAAAKTVCRIGIKIGDEWIWKANGAGDSDIEAEKGALSDAFKRAAVLWGIGRYLYNIESPWVPCETYEAGGKKHWKRWTADPWSCVRNASPAPANDREPAPKAMNADDFGKRIEAANTKNALDVLRKELEGYPESVLPQTAFDALWHRIDARQAVLSRKGPTPQQSLDALEEHLGAPQ